MLRGNGYGLRFVSWLLALAAVLLPVSRARCSADDAHDLRSLLEAMRSEHGLPGLAAAAVKDSGILVAEAVGHRKAGAPNDVTVEDKWHIGSCTKSMTATLAAVLVEQGQVHWNTTIGQVFPERKETIHEDFQSVTLDQLLCHRGSMPHELNRDKLWTRIWEQSTTLSPTEQRLFLLDGVLCHEPKAPVGTEYIYSNGGYAVAGAMLERIAGKPWESLITERLFGPLGMTSAGFGAPATPGKVDQPWGHIMREGCPEPMKPGPKADNPPAIGPGGTVHCSIKDFARYVAFHLRGERGLETLLSRESFLKLHTPYPGEGRQYARGWLVVRRPWGGGKVLSHGGSNTMFYAVMWLAPKKDFGVVVCTNVGGKEAEKGCDKTAGAMIKRYLLGTKK